MIGVSVVQFSTPLRYVTETGLGRGVGGVVMGSGTTELWSQQPGVCCQA